MNQTNINWLTLVICVLFAGSAMGQICPAYVPSGSTCTPLQVSPKEYYVYDWYQAGPFSSEGEAVADGRSYYISSLNHCGEITAGSNSDISNGAETIFAGIKQLDYWQHTFSFRGYQDSGCDQPGLSQPFNYLYHRTIDCPRGFTPYSNGANTQGICVRESTGVDDQKNLGACPAAPSAPPGSPEPPQACPNAGNSVNVATQNKFQAEVDYTGSGTFPLSFLLCHAETESRQLVKVMTAFC